MRARRISPVGKRILITGASSGIGRATAIAAAERGATVLLVARRTLELEHVRLEISTRGGTAYVYPCDLHDPDAIDALVGQVLAEHGAVDVLVNNAGHSVRRSVRYSLDRMHDYERTMRLNYFAPVRLTMGLLPAMQRQRFGHVVNVTTQGIQAHPPRYSAYLASKAALDEFGRTAGRELLSEGITFSSVRMPLVRTPMITPGISAYRGMPSWSAEQAARMVLRAVCTRRDVVHAPGGRMFQLLDLAVPGVMRLLVHRFMYLRGKETSPEVRGLRPVPIRRNGATSRPASGE